LQIENIYFTNYETDYKNIVDYDFNYDIKYYSGDYDFTENYENYENDIYTVIMEDEFYNNEENEAKYNNQNENEINSRIQFENIIMMTFYNFIEMEKNINYTNTFIESLVSVFNRINLIFISKIYDNAKNIEDFINSYLQKMISNERVSFMKALIEVDINEFSLCDLDTQTHLLTTYNIYNTNENINTFDEFVKRVKELKYENTCHTLNIVYILARKMATDKQEIVNDEKQEMDEPDENYVDEDFNNYVDEDFNEDYYVDEDFVDEDFIGLNQYEQYENEYENQYERENINPELEYAFHYAKNEILEHIDSIMYSYNPLKPVSFENNADEIKFILNRMSHVSRSYNKAYFENYESIELFYKAKYNEKYNEVLKNLKDELMRLADLNFESDLNEYEFDFNLNQFRISCNRFLNKDLRNDEDLIMFIKNINVTRNYNIINLVSLLQRKMKN
jgi:hypothetical protein